MKKHLLNLLALLLLSAPVYAQHFYYRLGAGYDLPLAGSMDRDGNHFNGSVDYLTQHDTIIYQSNYSIKKASFATGVHGEIAGGYMLNKNFGIELDASIGVAPKEYTFTEGNIWRDNVSTTETIKSHAVVPVLLIPSLVLQTGGDKVNFYTRMGMAVPVYSRIDQDDMYVNAPSGTLLTEEYVRQYKTMFSLGISAAAGLKFEMNSHLSLFGEINVLSMSLYAKENDLKEYLINGRSSYNGISNLSRIPPANVYYANSVNVAVSDPYHQLTFSFPYSSIGLHAGIVYKIDKSTKSHHGKKVNDTFNGDIF